VTPRWGALDPRLEAQKVTFIFSVLFVFILGVVIQFGEIFGFSTVVALTILELKILSCGFYCVQLILSDFTSE
jgi:hypothetical protein